MTAVETRACKKCGEIKPVDEFYPDRNYAADGGCGRIIRQRCYTCKTCYREQSSKYSKENADKSNARRRENKDKRTESNRKYREKNRDKVREWCRRQVRIRKEKKLGAIERKNGNLKWLFGINMDEYLEMLSRQGGVCAICSRREKAIDKRNGRPKFLSVDHCHDTGRIRMLLCWHCNTAIGKFNHDPALLRKAADYLERFMQ